MAKKKSPRTRKPAAKKKPAARKKPGAKRKPAAKKKRVARTPVKRVTLRTRSTPVSPLGVAARPPRRGLGASSAGQSGDTQGLSRSTDVDSESVEELLEEGQTFEAGAVGGVEHADADAGEVRTTQVLEDDVPREYDTD